MKAKKEFYSVREVAKILGLSPDRIYEYLRSGKIKGSRLTNNSAWRVHRSEIDRIKNAGLGDVAKSRRAPSEGKAGKSSGTAGEAGTIEGSKMLQSSNGEPKVAPASPPQKSDEQADKDKDSISAQKTKPADTGSSGVPSSIPTADKGDVVLSHVCVAPPDGINVAWIRSQKVPAKLAPGVLVRWRSAHEKGDHEVCRASRQLVEDLKSGVHAEQAEAMFLLGIRVSKLHVEEGLEHLELYRRYEGWRGGKHSKAFSEEADRRARTEPGASEAKDKPVDGA